MCFFKLVNEIRPLWRTHKRGRIKEKLENSLLITLWMLANQNSIREISDRFNFSVGKVHYIFLMICKMICSLTTRYICWPKNEEFDAVCKSFEKEGKEMLPGVIGCVDGTHIKIPAPKCDPISYYNRKGFHSLILQCVCDGNFLIRDVYFGVPGSCHDANVWLKSPLGQALENQNIKFPMGYHLLGDSAYPLTQYLITPFRDNGFLSEREKRFNYSHSAVRVSIEQTYGILKNKFRILNDLKIKTLKSAKYIVLCSIILHNFIRLQSNASSEITPQIEESQEDEYAVQQLDGLTTRQTLVEYMFPL